MSLTNTLLLGLIAGGTVLLGLPLGRLKRLSPSVRVTLNSVAVGVLLFLFWDVLSGAWEPIDGALSMVHSGDGGLGTAFGYGALFAAGLTVGLLGLAMFDRHVSPSLVQAKSGAGALPADSNRSTATEVVAPACTSLSGWSAAERTSLMIAIGIGLHNFAEGLAIGQASARDEIALATVLVIGFALHNATEGFGIVAPLAGSHDSPPKSLPSWRFLLSMGAIAGSPTLVGTLVGHSVTSEPLSVAFLTLAAGSIAYVIAQLLGVAARARRTDLIAFGLLLGVLAGFVTDAVVIAGGA